MKHTEVKHYWNGNAAAWTKLPRAGYDVYRDCFNTPAFFKMLPSVEGLSGLDICHCGSMLEADCGTDGKTRRLVHGSAGMPATAVLVELQTKSSVPVTCFRDSAQRGDELFVITEHCFGVGIPSGDIQISGEHKTYRWVEYETAAGLLTYDSNRTALWELNQRLLGLGPRTRPTSRMEWSAAVPADA